MLKVADADNWLKLVRVSDDVDTVTVDAGKCLC